MEIVLLRGETALIDDEDYELVKGYRWRLHKTHGGSHLYVSSGPMILMHRIIIGAKKGECVDHINGNGLDNRRKNIRICSHAQNMQNRKPNRGNKLGIKGVRFIPTKRRFAAEIEKDGCRYSRRFKDLSDAAAWYEQKSVELFGEFAFISRGDQ